MSNQLRKEKSCGCIIIDGNKNVLLIYEKNRNFWGFPKGHVELEENEIETALREVKEETGLDVEIDEKRRYVLNYQIRDEIDKTTVLYVAKPLNTEVIKQESEIEDAKWCSFNEALNTLTFDNWKELFSKVIADIEDTSMIEGINVLVHSSIKINNQQVIYIDPFKIEKQYNDADIIFITHDHYDHYSKEDIDKIKKNETISRVTEAGLSGGVGIFNINLERKSGENANSLTRYYYPITGTLSYGSIITQNNISSDYDGDIYTYLNSHKDLAKIFYTALGRERYGMYRQKLEF